MGLLRDIQSVEEVGRNGRGGKGADTAQPSNGLCKLIAVSMGDDDDVFRKNQAIGPDRNAVFRHSGDKGDCGLRLEPNLPNGCAIVGGKLVRRAAPERAQPGLGDRRHALHQVCVLRAPRHDFTVLLPIGRVFIAELLNFLTQLLDTLCRSKDGRAFLRAAWIRGFVDAQKRQTAGVETVFLQAFVGARPDFQINAGKIGIRDVWQCIDSLKQ